MDNGPKDTDNGPEDMDMVSSMDMMDLATPSTMNTTIRTRGQLRRRQSLKLMPTTDRWDTVMDTAMDTMDMVVMNTRAMDTDTPTNITITITLARGLLTPRLTITTADTTAMGLVMDSMNKDTSLPPMDTLDVITTETVVKS